MLTLQAIPHPSPLYPHPSSISVTATFSAVFKVDIFRTKIFAFRRLSKRDYPVIHVLSGPDWPASNAWHIEGWRIVKTPRERMLKWGRKIAIFRNERKLWVPLQTEIEGLKGTEGTEIIIIKIINHAEWDRNWKEIERNDQKWE